MATKPGIDVFVSSSKKNFGKDVQPFGHLELIHGSAIELVEKPLGRHLSHSVHVTTLDHKRAICGETTPAIVVCEPYSN